MVNEGSNGGNGTGKSIGNNKGNKRSNNRTNGSSNAAVDSMEHDVNPSSMTTLQEKLDKMSAMTDDLLQLKGQVIQTRVRTYVLLID